MTITTIYVISGFRREADENCALLGYYAASGGGPIGCPETSVRNHHYSLRNNLEGRSSHHYLLFSFILLLFIPPQ
jgi:hypothetical protein